MRVTKGYYSAHTGKGRCSIALALFFVQQTAHACCSSQTRVKPNDHAMTHTFSQHAQLTYCDCVVRTFKYTKWWNPSLQVSACRNTLPHEHISINHRSCVGESMNKLAIQIYYERSWHDRHTKRGWPIHCSKANRMCDSDLPSSCGVR